MKSIGISEKTHKELVTLKLEENNKNADEIIRKLIISYKKMRFMEASLLFNQKLKEKNISFKKLLKKSKAIREEVADELFPD